MSVQKPKPKHEPESGYWPYNPCYNCLLGYKEGKNHFSKSGGIKEYTADREVKDGKTLNK